MFLSYNFASDRGGRIAVFELQRGHSLDTDSATPLNTWMLMRRENKILEACFRNLLGLATRMFRENNRCIVERDCGGFDDVD